MSSSTLAGRDQPASAGMFPSTRDYFTGLGHTALLVRWRWRLIRRGSTRLLMLIGALLAFAFLFGASVIGELIRWVAESNARDTAAGDFAIGYLVAFSRGDFGGIAAFALGTAIAASIFGPLTGSSNLSLAPSEDLSTLKLHRLHRYFDSLVLQSFSTIGALQLLSLTTVASLLTLDGSSRGYALTLTWVIWVSLVFLTTAEGWLIELVYRKYGTRLRVFIFAAVASIVGAAIWLDPDHGSTFFGVGVHYATALQGDLESIPLWLPYVFIALLTLGFSILGAWLCNISLNRPAAPAKAKQDGVKVKRRLITLSSNPTMALYQTVILQMVRTQAVARPIIVVFLMAIPAMWITKGSLEAITTLVLAVPLAVVLGWTANALGVLGPGMTWLLSLPRAAKHIPAMVLMTSITAIAIIFGAALSVSSIAGRINLPTLISASIAMVVTGSLMTTAGLSRALRKPFLARLGTRGDAIVPPLAAINYTLRFAILSGGAGIITLSLTSLNMQLVIAAAAVIIAALRFLYLRRVWANRSRQAQITSIVAAG